MKAKFIFAGLFLLTTACSQQYRTSDPQVSTATLMQWLSDAQSSAQQLTGSSDIAALAADANTTIFFSDGPGPLGTVASVLSFDDIGFLGASNVGAAVSAVGAVRVFFLDNPSFNGGRKDVLLVGVAPKSAPDQFQYVSFSGSGYLDSGQFFMTFTGGDSRTYSARTFDLDGDGLGANIQLKIFAPDGGYVGKFPILAGYQ